MATRTRIGEILIDYGLITEEQLVRSLIEQALRGKRLGEVLIEMGAVTAEQVRFALARQKQLLAGLALATGLGMGLNAIAPQAARAGDAPSDVQTAGQQVVVSVPRVLAAEYTGSPLLQFGVEEADLARGYKVLSDQGDVRWRTNVSQWVINVGRSGWNTAAALTLWVRYGPGADPGGGDWFLVGEEPGGWLRGEVKGEGVFGGVDWKVTLPGSGLAPGVYITTVTITISEAE
jgi:hypothetical protein